MPLDNVVEPTNAAEFSTLLSFKKLWDIQRRLGRWFRVGGAIRLPGRK
jgi:hypothetical protein